MSKPTGKEVIAQPLTRQRMSKEYEQAQKMGRKPPVLHRWDKFIDYLMTEEWHLSNAYRIAFPNACASRHVSKYANRLMNNPQFLQYMGERQRTEYGYAEHRVKKLWLDKLENAQKEDNQLRASENIAKTLQMPGFSREDQQTSPINVFVGFKKDS